MRRLSLVLGEWGSLMYLTHPCHPIPPSAPKLHTASRYENQWGTTTADDTQMKMTKEYDIAARSRVYCTVKVHMVTATVPYTMEFNDGSQVHGRLVFKKDRLMELELVELSSECL